MQTVYVDTLHGVIIPDPYKWMEDIHSSELLKFVRAENKKTKAAIKKFRKMTRKFTKDAKRRQIISHPERELFEKPEGNYIYYTQRK
ncbi:MAG: hypothetical protein LBV41_11540, partial [Cytophagaceae bacterium]|nr:hypothetical protein [Cytophagaceae bacterium]